MKGGATFDSVLNKIRKESKNKRELGAAFEKVTLDFFTVDSVYSARFEKVWLWKRWPKNDGADTGIDLVALERNGQYCAIQCKCYADDGNLDMKAVSTFLAKAASLGMKQKILVYTGDTLTRHTEKVLRDSRCSVVRQENFTNSSVNWSDFPKLGRIKNPKPLHAHQREAVRKVLHGLESRDRGQLIMACGTGKTLTSLHVAERYCHKGGIVLYLVPSISLILQSMREWSDNANMRHYYLAVCSDRSTGEDGSITELESPVSTDVDTLVPYLKKRPTDALTVVFSTYHSLGVVRGAMKGSEFDMILCDEAHRTTGAENKSFFTDVHQDSKIQGKKRLYMTATPRVYSDAILARTGKVVYSMDDESKYGPVLHRLRFAEAVRLGILSDFRVKIAIVPADRVDREFQQSLGGKEKSIPLDERTMLAAVWHGINYPDDDKKPKMLQRIIAFANRIDRSMMFAGQVPDEGGTDRSFGSIVSQYEEWNPTGHRVEVDHIDGKTKALDRRKSMRWLDESTDDSKTCRILSNARCLAEGVDVPALDGVVFLNPRKSRVDVVQSVGRVMRKSKGKKYGYVILPVAIPAGLKYHEALNDNKTFKVVWQVLNALRSHDEDFGHEINRLILDQNPEATGPPRVSVSVLDETVDGEPLTKFFSSIKTKLVEKVGDINYYDKYGENLGSAASTIEARIRNRMKKSLGARREIEKLHVDLKGMINDSVTLDSTIQVIAQHVVLSRVFDMLFSDQFTTHNPISSVLNKITQKIGLEEELRDLTRFYEDVRLELKDVTTREARQSFIKKIYGNFFESADKKGVERHGVVYTPVEVIDFIIHSVDHLLKTNFGVCLNDRPVKIIDPFAGTGTFLTRLLESGLIKGNLYEKYKNDLFADELILLAYYVATVNIETTYSSLRRGNPYVSFEGISYTDTLKINPRYRMSAEHKKEQKKIDSQFQAAHERIRQQRGSHVHVIIGNPPYSKGQKVFSDENKNIKYPELEKRIRETYFRKTSTHDKKSLYDSYVQSIRWASDRIGNSGIIAFVTNASFLRSETAAGIRASLIEEFNGIWCFDLGGKKGMEGDGRNIFEYVGKSTGGTTVSTVILLLVKNPLKQTRVIKYAKLESKYYSGQDKRDRVKELKSMLGITDWQIITPDKHHDWLDQRKGKFNGYTPIGTKDTKAGRDTLSIFKMYSLGVATHRDIWIYNSSADILAKNIKAHIKYCNAQNPKKPTHNPKKAMMDSTLLSHLKKMKTRFNKNNIRIASYRPFFKQQMYFDRVYNSAPYQIPKFFPEPTSRNLVIIIPDKGKTGMFSVLITDIIPDLHLIEQSQCFPMYVYEGEKRKENITDYILKEYHEYYNDTTITKQDIFYYIYGLLHHPAYKKEFANNLSREFPHIPMAPAFTTFKNIGYKLAKLHLSFDVCSRYNLGKPKFNPKKFTKLAFGKKGADDGDGRISIPDYSLIKADGAVLFENIPDIKYKVNGRTPIQWIKDRYKISRDEESGITNDPCTKTDIVAIIERAVHVGVESDRLIGQLPKEFEPKNWKPKKTGLDKYSEE